MHTQVFLSAQRIEGDLRDQGFLPPLPASVSAAPAQPSPPAAASPSAASTTNSERPSPSNSEQPAPSPVSAAGRVAPSPPAPPAVSLAAEDVAPAKAVVPLLMVRCLLADLTDPSEHSHRVVNRTRCTLTRVRAGCCRCRLQWSIYDGAVFNQKLAARPTQYCDNPDLLFEWSLIENKIASIELQAYSA